MEDFTEPSELTIKASVGRHLAFAPVAFAVTEGRTHALLYANAVFRQLYESGAIRIGPRRPMEADPPPSAADLTPLLDHVYASAETVRDAIIKPARHGGVSWSCTVWPVPGPRDVPEKLVIEVRDIEMLEGAKVRQRDIAQRLLLGALREQDIARDAVRVSDGAQHLAKAARDLSMSLDEAATRDTVRRLTLPRAGTWCIVDVVESNGSVHRLAVVHPDPKKQALARKLEELWPPEKAGTDRAASFLPPDHPTVVTQESGAALLLASHGTENLRLLREIGFGSLLVVPLIVRARVHGAITFVSRQGDAPFTPDETTLAVDLAGRCALALDNARLYREADALRLVAERANQSKGQFLGSMSHELRTPLNAIGGFTELIDMGIQGAVTEAQHVSLARIKANQQHLVALVTEVLNFVRVESGRMEYHFGPVSMPDAFRDIVEMLSGAISDKELTLDGPHCGPEAMALADPNRVRQVLVNLVMNAVKYTPQKGGTITLTCEVVGETVLAHVADSGPGIPREKVESIFEPFVQLSSGADRSGGVGLGLAISRDLARAMNGDLTVESTVGVGSRFTLRLPLTAPGTKTG